MKVLQVVTTLIILAKVQCHGYGHESSCGKRLVNHKGLITNGFFSNEGDWPWHAAIDHLTRNIFEYKCGGTVLNSKTILTAGHCVYEDHRPVIPERVKVQLGLYNVRFPGANTQQFEVFEIIPHPRYNTKTLVNDIAIIRLSTEATLNNYVQPICLWDSSKVALSEVEGKNGAVVGWGYTELDEISTILRHAVMPIVRHTACLNSNPEFYRPFVTDRTFCAGFRNGTSVCSGDSGGSLTFEVGGVYRIRGIVSLSQSRNDKPLCNSEEFVVFTDVAKYLTWIDDMINHVNTSSESEKVKHEFHLVNYKGLTTNGFSAKEGDWPWHAAIDHLINHKFVYKCSGTVLNSKTILTAGHCGYEDDLPIVPQRVKVQLGLYNLRYPGTTTQQFQVFKIIPHPKFNPKTLVNDIGIIRLSTEASLNNYVQPINLWDSSIVASSEVEGKYGAVVGWAYTETVDIPVILRQAYIPIEKCPFGNNTEFYERNFINDTVFCAGFPHGTSVCSGDGGGSITFEVDRVYQIRGILSLSQSRNDKPLCNSEEYVAYTDVAKYLTWIDETITHASTAVCPDNKNEVHPYCTCADNYFYDANEFICVRKCPDDAIQMRPNCLCKSVCAKFSTDSWSCGGNRCINPLVLQSLIG